MDGAMNVEKQMADLEAGARELGISLGKNQLSLFRTYTDKILDWNRRRNIVSRKDEGRIASYHIIDSLSALSLIPDKTGVRCLDVGSGAGFPGIPLRIVRPDILLTLAEPRRWRYLFLRNIVETLALENVTLFEDRVEAMPPQDPLYDCILVRAVAPLKEVVPVAMPHLSRHGLFVAFKSQSVAEETSEAAREILSEGGRVVGTKKIILPITRRARFFVSIEKS
jgi:16S rRNA (guanine527-N7)-methyltransferase